MTYSEEIQRRIELKRQLIVLTEEEIVELENELLEDIMEIERGKG